MRISLRLALLGSLVPLAGCMTTGTNMHNDFACRAPNGTCAPMSVIDGKAVAGMGAMAQPIGGIVDPAMPREGRVVTASADGTPGRTADRVLRVVFPAHIDASGIYHDEASAHAVVEHGTWTDGMTGGQRREAAGTQVAVSQVVAPDASQTSKLATLDEIVAGRAVQARRSEGAAGTAVPAVTPTTTSPDTVALVTRLSMMRAPGAIDLREAAAAASAGPVGGLDPNFDTPDVTTASVDEPGAPSGHCTGYRPVWWHGHAYRRLRPVPCPVVAAVSAPVGLAAVPAPLPGTTAALNRAVIERTAAPAVPVVSVATAAAASSLSGPAATSAVTNVATAAKPAAVSASFAPTTDSKTAAARVSAMTAPIVGEQLRLGRADAKAAAVPELGSLFARAGDTTTAGNGAPR